MITDPVTFKASQSRKKQRRTKEARKRNPMEKTKRKVTKHRNPMEKTKQKVTKRNPETKQKMTKLNPETKQKVTKRNPVTKQKVTNPRSGNATYKASPQRRVRETRKRKVETTKQQEEFQQRVPKKEIQKQRE